MFNIMILLCLAIAKYPTTTACPYNDRWERQNITWGLSREHTSKSLSLEDTLDVLRKVVEEWNQVVWPALTITEALPTVEPDIKILFVTGEHGDGYNFNGMGYVIAHAFCPKMGGAIHLDDAEVWSAKRQSNGRLEFGTTNLYVTAIHEFGHSLGLSHDYNRRSIMYPYYRDIEYLPANWKHWARQDVEILYNMPPTPPPTTLTLPTTQTTHEPELSNSIFEIISLTATKRDQRMPATTITTTKKDDLCADYDSVVEINGRLVLFRGNWMKKIKSRRFIDDRRVRWPGLEGVVRGAIQGFDDHGAAVGDTVLFVTTDKLWLYRKSSLQAGYPKSLSDLGILEPILLAIPYRGVEFFLFSQTTFWVVNGTDMHVSIPSGPRSSIFPGLEEYTIQKGGVLHKGLVFFFEGARYRTYNMYTRQLGPSKPIWFKCGA